VLVHDPAARTRLVRELFAIIDRNARAETRMLLALHRRPPALPLHQLSVRTSEQLLALQQMLYERLPQILKDRDLVRATLAAYVPQVLVEELGIAAVMATLDTAELQPYRDAILTKKLAAMALYRHAVEWDAFVARVGTAPVRTLKGLFGEPGAAGTGKTRKT
jgi:glutamate dehydrogenase